MLNTKRRIQEKKNSVETYNAIEKRSTKRKKKDMWRYVWMLDTSFERLNPEE